LELKDISGNYWYGNYFILIEGILVKIKILVKIEIFVKNRIMGLLFDTTIFSFFTPIFTKNFAFLHQILNFEIGVKKQNVVVKNRCKKGRP